MIRGYYMMICSVLNSIQLYWLIWGAKTKRPETKHPFGLCSIHTVHIKNFKNNTLQNSFQVNLLYIQVDRISLQLTQKKTEIKDCTVDIYTVDTLHQFMRFESVVCKEFDGAVQECAVHHRVIVSKSFLHAQKNFQ